VVFQPDFWVATSAAAPVIALAVVVTLPDLSDDLNEVAHSLDQAQTERPATPSPAELQMLHRMLSGMVTFLAAMSNLLAQAALLVTSLLALADDDAVIAPWFAITLAVGGLMLLFFVAGRQRDMQNRLRRKLLARYQGGPDDRALPPAGST